MKLSCKPDLSGKVAVVTGGCGVLFSSYRRHLPHFLDNPVHAQHQNDIDHGVNHAHRRRHAVLQPVCRVQAHRKGRG